MTSELKPCPFCGKTPKINFKVGSYGYTPDSWVIKCYDCHVKFGKWIQKGTGIKDKQEVIKRWNTRYYE